MKPLGGRNRSIAAWIVAALLATAAPARLSAAALRLVGSDLLGAEFTAAVQEFAQRNEVPLSLALEGSRAGITQLESGGADFGLIILPPGEEPPGTPFKGIALAYHVVVVLVPESSPLAQITFRELGGIYGAAESASFTRWGELGLTGEWASRAIVPQAMSPGAELSLELFRRIVLGEGKLRGVVAVQSSAGALLRKLETDAGGIALIAARPADLKKIRVLPVTRADRDIAFSPTPENVHTGDYPLRLPVWLVVRREAAREQLNFLRFLLSDDVAPLLDRAGLVTLPLPARNQLVFDLEQL